MGEGPGDEESESLGTRLGTRLGRRREYSNVFSAWETSSPMKELCFVDLYLVSFGIPVLFRRFACFVSVCPQTKEKQ